MRKAQIFTLDLIFALIILLFVSFLLLTARFPQVEGDRTQDDALALASSLFSPYPEDWNQSAVVRPGFVVDHRVQDVLLQEFANLSQNEVSRLTGIASQYQIIVYNNTGVAHTFGVSPANATSLHVIRRYAVYQQNITEIEVIAWQ